MLKRDVNENSDIGLCDEHMNTHTVHQHGTDKSLYACVCFLCDARCRNVILKKEKSNGLQLRSLLSPISVSRSTPAPVLRRDERYRSLHGRSDGMCGKEQEKNEKHCIILQRSLQGLKRCQGNSYTYTFLHFTGEELSEVTLLTQLVTWLQILKDKVVTPKGVFSFGSESCT